MSDWKAEDQAFAGQHECSIPEAVAYRRGREAWERGSSLHVNALSRFDAWYAAGWNDADINAGRSVLEVAL